MGGIGLGTWITPSVTYYMCLPHILSKRIILSSLIILFTSFIKTHPWLFNEVSILHLFICHKGIITAQSKATLNIFHESHYHSREIFHQLFILLQPAILGWHSARLGNTWAGTGELTHTESCILFYPSLRQFSHTMVYAAPDVGPTPLQVQISLTAQTIKLLKHTESLQTAASHYLWIPALLACVVGNYQQVGLIWSKSCSTDYRLLFS